MHRRNAMLIKIFITCAISVAQSDHKYGECFTITFSYGNVIISLLCAIEIVKVRQVIL